jgi:hypothetical protein
MRYNRELATGIIGFAVSMLGCVTPRLGCLGIGALPAMGPESVRR